MIRMRVWVVVALVATGAGCTARSGVESMIALEGHVDRVNSVAFSPDGRLLASGGGTFDGLLQEPQPGETIVWLDVGKSLQHVVLDGHKDGVSSVVFSPDGATLATGSFDCSVILWNVTTWRKLATIVHFGGSVQSVAFSPDGKVLATGGWGGNVEESRHEAKLWDTRTHALIATLSRHTSGITSVAFSPDGRRLATGSMDGTAKVWDVASRNVETTLQVSDEQWVLSVAFSPDGSLLAAGGGLGLPGEPGEITLWRCDGWKPAGAVDAQGEIVSCVVFSPDGKTLASCGEDGGIAFWDVAHLRRERVLLGHDRTWVQGITFSPDGKRLASAGSDGSVAVWEL